MYTYKSYHDVLLFIYTRLIITRYRVYIQGCSRCCRRQYPHHKRHRFRPNPRPPVHYSEPLGSYPTAIYNNNNNFILFDKNV